MLLGVLLNGALRLLTVLVVSPEKRATVLPISHRPRSDTCKKPGTAFTMEYRIPGRDDKTL
eukprot:2795133-Amphidinium_carterae.1